MLSREDFTDSEYVFLESQKILLSQVFDARGRGPTSFYDEAKAAGMLFGMALACEKGGHRLFTRKGHCIQCDTSKIAFARRFSDKGYVYIAGTLTGKLIKVGSTSDIRDRAMTLNTEGGYAGFSDWKIIAHAKTANMGRVEFEIHKAVQDLAISMDYVRAGRRQVTREVMKGDLKRIWSAYQAAIGSIAKSECWQIPKISEFDFVGRA